MGAYFGFFVFLIYLYVYGPYGHDVEDRGQVKGAALTFQYVASREIKLWSAALMAGAFMKHSAISPAHQFGLF